MLSIIELDRHPNCERIIISNAFFRKNCADSYFFAVLIRQAPLLDDMGLEARTSVGAWHSSHATDDTTDHATGNCSDSASRPFTILCVRLDAARNTSGLDCNENGRRDNNSRNAKTADHDNSLNGYRWENKPSETPNRITGAINVHFIESTRLKKFHGERKVAQKLF